MEKGMKKAISIVNIVAGAILLLIGMVDIDWAWGQVALVCGVGIFVVGILELLNKSLKVIGIVQIVFGSADILLGFICDLDFDWTYVSLLTGTVLLVTGILRTLNKSQKAIGIIEIVFAGILLLIGIADIECDWGISALAAGVSFLVSGILLLIIRRQSALKTGQSEETRAEPKATKEPEMQMEIQGTETQSGPNGVQDAEMQSESNGMQDAERRAGSNEVQSEDMSDDSKKEVHRKVMFLSGICSAALLFVSCILPMYGVSILGIKQSRSYAEGDGVFVMVFALLAVGLILYKKYRLTVVPAVLSSLLVIYDMVQLRKTDDFGSLIQFQIGFYLMVIALIGLWVCVVEAFWGKWDRKGKKSNIISAAMMAVSVLLLFVAVLVGSRIEDADKYESAEKYMEEEEYEKALEELKELGDYKDAEDKSKECSYLWAEQLLSEGEYEDAGKMYRELKDYKDSEEMLAKCDLDAIVSDYDAEFSPDRVEYIKKITALNGGEEAEEQCQKIVEDELKSCYSLDEAIAFLEKISGDFDVETLLAECWEQKEEQDQEESDTYETDTEQEGETEETVEEEDGDEEEEQGQYLLPTSDRKKLKKREILALTVNERRLARNEIYARHGRKFLDPSLQKYFDKQDWYVPVFSPDEFDEGMLNKVEKYNLRLIKKYE